MLITEIRLIKFKRFALNQIDDFTLTPTAIVQLILGSNGAGKSSLIRQLTPLPANGDDFYKDGSKTIHISSRGNNYILRSTFSPNRHSFIKNDNIEMNPGGSVTVFKELVKQEFNITTDVHDLMIGEELFHQMSPMRRRDWFTKLSDTNYDYALSVYNKLKERSRDTAGALKLSKSRLTAETAKLISEDEENKLREDAGLTHKELTLLMEQNAPLTNSVQYYRNEQSNNLAELEKLSIKLLRMKYIAPYGTHPYGIDPTKVTERDDWGELIKVGFTSIEEVEKVISNLSHKATAIEVLLNNALKEHGIISDKIDILIRTGNEGVTALSNSLATLELNKIAELNKRSLGLNIEHVEVTINSLESIYDIISDIAMAIPANEDKRYSSIRMNELDNRMYLAKDRKQVLVSNISKLEAKITHLESHKNNGTSICPKCHHSWIPGFSDEALSSLIENLTALNFDLVNDTNSIADMQIEIDAIKEYSSFYRDFTRCVSNWPVLKQFWDYLMDGNYLLRSPRMIVSILDTFKADLVHDLKAFKIDEEIANKIELIKAAEAIGDANLNDLQFKLNEYSTYIGTETSKLNLLKRDIGLHSEYRRDLLEASKLGNRIKELMVSVNTATSDMVEMIRRETLSHCIKQLQSSLALKENTLNGINIQKSIIDDLKKQIDKLTIEEQAAKALVKELSPTEGLIGDGLLGFIKSFVKQMNLVIKSVWAYPLKVLDCGGTDGELDFKFKVEVNYGDDPVPDVKEVSLGQREIINLAFRLTAAKYLGLADAPLYLDEGGTSLDNEHKIAFWGAIKNLMETSHFPQLFIVAHDYTHYGSLANAEVCVLDGRNIVVPDIHNTHVIIA